MLYTGDRIPNEPFSNDCCAAKDQALAVDAYVAVRDLLLDGDRRRGRAHGPSPPRRAAEDAAAVVAGSASKPCRSPVIILASSNTARRRSMASIAMTSAATAADNISLNFRLSPAP